jgi:TPR repeat protein
MEWVMRSGGICGWLGRRACGAIVATALIFAALPAFAQSYSTEVANRYVQTGDWSHLLTYTQQWTRAEPQSPMAWLYFGNTLLHGFKRPAEAIQSLQRATALKPDWAQAWFFLGQAQAMAGQYPVAGPSLERAIELNPTDTNAYTNLVDVYELDLKGHQQAAAAPIFAYLQKRATGGDATAQSMLGNMYHDGRGVPQNDATAMAWYAKSAAQGHAYAQYSLGNGYMLGIGGLPQDQAKATQLFVAAAQKGLADAQEAAAVSYELGRGTSRNRAQAIYWLDQAAKQGDIYSAGFAKILRNPNTPAFHNDNEVENFVESVFQYCWHDRFPERRPDLESPGYHVWQSLAPNWRDSYCN